jgi:hypothetical protein
MKINSDQDNRHLDYQIVFLISSPLQALACWLILNDDIFNKRANIIVGIEGHCSIPDLPNVTKIKLKDTRKSKKNIKDNIKTILPIIHGKCDLWVSDLLWPMNNAIYSSFRATKYLKSINFIDEGTVMYVNTSKSYYLYIRELMKSLILKLYFKHYSFPSRKLYSESERNGRIAAYNPELINNFKNIFKISIEPKNIDQYAKSYIKNNQKIEIENINSSDNSVLILAQPYYRVLKSDLYKDILTALKIYLNQRGFSNIFIKLHPSETIEDFNIHYSQLGFQIVFSDLKSIPAEIILSKLDSKVIVASFGTSAFINARKFGFQGEMLVYGLETIVLNSIPFQAKLQLQFLKDLYIKSDCNLVEFISNSVKAVHQA